MATHSSVLAWRIPWTEEPGGLQSMGLQRVGQGLARTTCKEVHQVLGRQKQRVNVAPALPLRRIQKKAPSVGSSSTKRWNPNQKRKWRALLMPVPPLPAGGHTLLRVGVRPADDVQRGRQTLIRTTVWPRHLDPQDTPLGGPAPSLAPRCSALPSAHAAPSTDHSRTY